MREAIELLIDDYERRVRSAIAMLDDPKTTYEQRVRVQGKRSCYNLFILELKAVLANGENDSSRVQANADQAQEQIPSGQNDG